MNGKDIVRHLGTVTITVALIGAAYVAGETYAGPRGAAIAAVLMLGIALYWVGYEAENSSSAPGADDLGGEHD